MGRERAVKSDPVICSWQQHEIQYRDILGMKRKEKWSESNKSDYDIYLTLQAQKYELCQKKKSHHLRGLQRQCPQRRVRIKSKQTRKGSSGFLNLSTIDVLSWILLFLVVRAVLCISGCWATSLASIYQTPMAISPQPPSCDY